MPSLTATTRLPFSRNDVFAWHERSGAFTRLTPPGFARVIHETDLGLHPGSRAELSLIIPGLRLPMGPEATWRWVAQHTQYDPPRSFSDRMESGPMRLWEHERQFTSDTRGTILTEHIHFQLPRLGLVPGVHQKVTRQLERFFAYRGRVLMSDLAFHTRFSRTPKHFLIAGSSGLVGTQLVAFLQAGGHRVQRLVRRRDHLKSNEISWDPAAGRVDASALDDVDVVINVAGQPIAGRFTAAHLQDVRTSRLDTTRLLAETLAQRQGDGRPRALINASASGYFGASRGDEPLLESSAPGAGPLAEIVQDWEAATRVAAEAGVRVALVRTGIVQSPAGGQLGLQLPMFQWGVGGPLGHGKQWLPWIAIDDIVRIYAFLALTDAEGPFNASAPTIVTGNDYARILASVLHRPGVFRVPALGPTVLLGRDGATELALASQRMMPSRLTDAGFQFQYRGLPAALTHVLALDTHGPTQVVWE